MDVSQPPRNFSVSDLLGNPLGLGLGSLGSLNSLSAFHRTDSEADFKEFLRRIPSSSNLLSAQDGTAAAAQTAQAAALQTAGSLGGAALGLMPRVPSLQALASAPLDLLQQLVHQQQQAASALPPSPVVKFGLPGGAAYLPTLSAAELATLNAAALTATTTPAAAAAAAAAAALNPSAHLAAAAALQQLNPLPASRSAPGPGPGPAPPATHGGASQARSTQNSGGSSDGELDQHGNERNPDDRRARRMLSNRESARRSRRRKQEHLGQLEAEVGVLAEEKKVWADKIAGLERRFASAEDENKRLRGENERLLDELRFLRSELKERNTYVRRNGREDSDEEGQRSKKAKVGAKPGSSEENGSHGKE